jgi:hypothetical protein
MVAAQAVLFNSNARTDMLPYHDREGDPSILGYVDDSAFIRLFFRDGNVLEFGVHEIGASHLINLRQLARMGDGLPQYVKRNELRPLGRPVKQK